jgi:ADP-ribose pyrophosphatase YjhB (NUDIX family)
VSIAESSRDRVEGHLTALEESYASFPVNQTTLGVATDVYERTREQCRKGIVDLYVTVHNDTEDVLVVDREDAWEVPNASPAASERLEAEARRAVEAETGVECSITDLERVTILGLVDENDADRETLYRLVAVFDGHAVAGSPGSDGEWRAQLPDGALPSY